jgi:hypothetical protein
MITKSMIIGELPLTIEWMIENTLLPTILNFILKQIIRPWWTFQNDNQFDPLHGLLKIKKWGTLQKKQGG